MAEKSASKATTKSKKSVKKAVKKKAASKKATTAKSSTAKSAKKTAEKSGNKTAAAKKSGQTTGTKKSKLAVKSNPSADSKRLTLIQQTAYYIAEKRGFVGGDPEQDWLMAEKQVDEMLKQSST